MAFVFASSSIRCSSSSSLLQQQHLVTSGSSFLQHSLQGRLLRGHQRRIAVLAQRNVHVAPKGKDGASSTPVGISALDLWAIHDLLLIGHRGPLLQGSPAATSTVQEAANSLAGMLDKIHPIPACREAIAKVDSLADKAESSWTCLGLSKNNFTGPFTSNDSNFYDAANTKPTFDSKLGVCAGSKWPRACSYWAAMHAMGVRADMGSTPKQYLQAIVRIISGGALYCFGCTSHWRLLNKHLLPAELQDGANLISY